MFVMTNDGGAADFSDDRKPKTVLLQRTFVFQLLTSGTSVVLLKDVEFCDHKVASFSTQDVALTNKSCRFLVSCLKRQERGVRGNKYLGGRRQ